MSAAERIAVMEGELDGIDLVEVLQVVGIGRQYTGVELRRSDNSLFGTLFIKAGKVVAAASGDTQGKEAFFLLFQRVNQEPKKFFHVFRAPAPPELPQPLGSLGHLLMEALERVHTAPPALPQKASSGVMPKPHATEPNGQAPRARDTAPPSLDAQALSRAPVAASAAGPVKRRPSSATNEAVPVSRGDGGGRGDSAPRSDVSVRPGNARPVASGRSGQMNAVRGEETVAKVSGGGASRRVVLGVASPKGGSGKTTIALNLSLSLARQGRSVILLDTDINGDVLSSIRARERAEHGAYDVLAGSASAASALLRTVLPNFRILPAMGQRLPETSALLADQERAWHKLIDQLSEEAELVIVDMPAGMFGPTLQVATRCTHLLGVLQAELIASRSFAMFKRAIEVIPEQRRPEVAGVVLNMLQSRQAGSVTVLQEACSMLPRGWLLDTTIPRSDAFLHATEEGLPLRLLDDLNPPAASWLFDTLASELTERLGLKVSMRQPRRLLL